MKQQFKTILEKSLQIQDLRNDKGHAEAVAGFAEQLCSVLGGDDRIVMPAAILHDVGYFGMDKQLLKGFMEKKLAKEQEMVVKKEHAEKGADIAEKMLKELGYPGNIVVEVKRIILYHDADIVSRTKEESIVRDADKLWRYSRGGFFLDVKRRGCRPEEWYEKLRVNLDKPGYFCLELSKRMAGKELEDRKKEMW